jgi:hypothetical protein
VCRTLGPTTPLAYDVGVLQVAGQRVSEHWVSAEFVFFLDTSYCILHYLAQSQGTSLGMAEGSPKRPLSEGEGILAHGQKGHVRLHSCSIKLIFVL